MGLRTISKGGAASPLLRCMALEPVIEAAAGTAAGRCPTYVDDLAALLEAAEQALRVSVLLLWASHTAAPLVATHASKGLALLARQPGLAAARGDLLVAIGRAPDGLPIIRGLIPE